MWMIDSKKEVNEYFGGNLFYYRDDWVTFWHELKYLSFQNFPSLQACCNIYKMLDH